MARELTDEQIGIICECIQRPKLAIWADMGAGKTAITLHAIAELFRLGMITRAVVVAPRAVADSTWAQEAALWPDTQDLRVVVLRGTPAQRKAQAEAPADVFCIGRDGLAERNARGGCIASADLSTLAKTRHPRFSSSMRRRPSKTRVQAASVHSPTSSGVAS